MPNIESGSSTKGQGAATKPLSWIEINLGQIEANVRAIRHALAQPSHGSESNRPEPWICAVVKKNAYGLGAVPIAHRLIKAGVDMLAVYSASEAEELVKASVTAPILALMPVRELERTSVLYRHAVAGRLHLSVHDPSQLDELETIGRTFGLRWPVHLYLDTGMSRGGLSPAQFKPLIGDIARCRHIQLAGVYTHPATADVDTEFLGHQMGLLQRAINDLDHPLASQVMIHGANTSTVLRDAEYHLDMVRPGIGLYGFGPEWLEAGKRLDPMPDLNQVVRWISRVRQVQTHEANIPVGYGSTYRLTRPSTLGIIPVGYGDGYPLALSNKAKVRITPPHASNQSTPVDCPLLGQVNMDQLIIDLTDLGASDPNDLIDAEAEIYSDDPDSPNNISSIARLANTHPYEILCRLNLRLPRHYLSSS